MNYGFIRAACVSPELKIADCKFNGKKIIDCACSASLNDALLVVFPELCITGSTCGDLFLNRDLQKSAVKTLEDIAGKTKDLNTILAVGLPVVFESCLYNCAAILYKGNILCIIPKSSCCDYGNEYLNRYFSLFLYGAKIKTVYISEKYNKIPFGTNILVCDKNSSGFVLAAEVGEDLLNIYPPSLRAASSGASIIVNLCALNAIIGRDEEISLLIKAHSFKTKTAYIFANAGQDESSQDSVFAGRNIIAENGHILKESLPFSREIIYADIDLERICAKKQQIKKTHLNTEDIFKVEIDLNPVLNFNHKKELFRFVEMHPFVPQSKNEKDKKCLYTIQMQSHALAKRIRHINVKTAVIGLSGGLDSSLALLIVLNSFKICGLPEDSIHAVTMPCFGTTDRTYNNACKLALLCKTSLLQIDISASVKMHFKEIGHDENIHNCVYENAQARKRTQILMDIANKTGGIVIGTGDLSEAALGWCTYNGDHMSMYNVNGGIPKTFVRSLVEWFSEKTENKALSELLKDILNTPVSPELLPAANGSIMQKTEDLVGPYELHDFYLYYVLKYGFSPQKILFLAEKSNLPYTYQEKVKWLKIFYKRFFSQQFKRSCMPDGVKVGSICLSPRGAWHMPSDISCSLWLEEIENLKFSEE